jgi:hypothetical protein
MKVGRIFTLSGSGWLPHRIFLILGATELVALCLVAKLPSSIDHPATR